MLLFPPGDTSEMGGSAEFTGGVILGWATVMPACLGNTHTQVLCGAVL